MSFSSDIKNALCRIDVKNDNVAKAELFGILRTCAMVSVRHGEAGIDFVTENAAIARRVLQTLKICYGVQSEVIVTRDLRLRKKNRYHVLAFSSRGITVVMTEFGLLLPDGTLNSHLLETNDGRRCFLRGAFLATGSVNKPSSGYHLEIVTENNRYAVVLKKLFVWFGLRPGIVQRRNVSVVYVKSAESVYKFLGLIGANGAVLDFMSTKVIREIRNSVNRAVNCETANLSKTAKAAAMQLQAIHYVEDMIGIEALPVFLSQTAKLRLDHPNASLSEIVEHAGGISRSALSQRLKRIVMIAESYGMERK